jgi:stage III sporulation protein SpoIIIAA
LDLIGGIQYVTLSDDEAKRRGTQKSILERKAYPAFEIIMKLMIKIRGLSMKMSEIQ